MQAAACGLAAQGWRRVTACGREARCCPDPITTPVPPPSAAARSSSIEIEELRAALAQAQDECVELAVDAGELHRVIEELQAENARLRADRDAWRQEARRHGAGAAA